MKIKVQEGRKFPGEDSESSFRHDESLVSGSLQMSNKQLGKRVWKPVGLI